MEEYKQVSEIDKTPITKKQLDAYRDYQVSIILNNINQTINQCGKQVWTAKYELMGQISVGFLTYAMQQVSKLFKSKRLYYLIKFKKSPLSKFFSIFNLYPDKVFIKLYLRIPRRSRYQQQIYSEIIQKQNKRLTQFSYTLYTPILNNIHIYHNYKLALKNKGYRIQRTQDKKGKSCIVIRL